jgi:hypothetical protein
MDSLDHIAAQGNRGDDNWITCADGFRLSVIAREGVYCTPRPRISNIAVTGDVPSDYPGPFIAVEVGFPSSRPEPWDEWREYVEDDTDPTGTVYGYVPVALVRALIESHGGERV